MRSRRRPATKADIDVTAFSDIAFLLIIFFILTTTFVKPFGHRMKIPAGTSKTTAKDDTLPSLVLRGQKILYGAKGEELDLDGLRLRLDREQFRRQPEEKRMVVVECTKDVPYEHYFQVVMAITEAGGALALVEEDQEAEK